MKHVVCFQRQFDISIQALTYVLSAGETSPSESKALRERLSILMTCFPDAAFNGKMSVLHLGIHDDSHIFDKLQVCFICSFLVETYGYGKLPLFIIMVPDLCTG